MIAACARGRLALPRLAPRLPTRALSSLAVDISSLPEDACSSRDTMRKYWDQHSAKGTIQEMMLDDNAAIIEQQDREEILSLLPHLDGKRVLELAAGIGRFTPHLSERVGPDGSVLAVEFIQKFSDANQASHAHMGNIDFVCGDVCTLDLSPGSQDVVFINWLLMYLSDDEVQKFATNALRWLAPGGHLFFRESCVQQSGTKAREFNPTHYRQIAEYSRYCEQAESDGFKFEQRRLQSSQTYIQAKGNPNQMIWLWKKVPA